MKENDVYEWKYSDKYKNELKIKYAKDSCNYNLAISMHCKDGLALVNNNLKMIDTYWNSSSFELDILDEEYKFKFLCNLDDYDELSLYKYNIATNKYKENDLFVMRIQAGYRNRYFIKKGAVEDKDIILDYLKEELKNKKSSFESIKRDIEILEIQINKFKNENN